MAAFRLRNAADAVVLRRSIHHALGVPRHERTHKAATIGLQPLSRAFRTHVLASAVVRHELASFVASLSSRGAGNSGTGGAGLDVDEETFGFGAAAMRTVAFAAILSV